MGLAEIVALLLALFIPTALFIIGYYFFARTLDPFRRKERKSAHPINTKLDDASSAAQIADINNKIRKLYKKGDKFAAYELYKQAYSVSFSDAETAVEHLFSTQ